MNAVRLHIIIFVISLLVLAYPIWRLGVWLGLPDAITMLVTAAFFLSQYIARFLLRHQTSTIAYIVRQFIDFLFGLAPIIFVQVLVAELLIGIFDMPSNIIASSIVVITIVLGCIGLIRAWHPNVVTIALRSTKVSKPLRFVQISDVHIGSRTSRFLKQVVQSVNELNPDFLCITGDFIDQPGVSLEKLSSLQQLHCPIYYCIGNHERYEDLDDIITRLEALDVTVLRNRSVMYGDVQIIGIDDADDSEQVAKVLPYINVGKDHYSILLYHRPEGLKAADKHGIDLKLSGHTHNGQIVPFSLVVNQVYKYNRGTYQYGNTTLHVNEGTGTWGPMLRIGTQSEISLFELSSVQP